MDEDRPFGFIVAMPTPRKSGGFLREAKEQLDENFVVDDSRAMRSMIRRTLRQAGFDRHTVLEALMV